MHTAPIIKEHLAQYLPARPIILEAGAHIGRDTLKMIKIWPEATLYAFEPVPHLYQQLVEKTSQYPSIHTYNLALSDSTGHQEFYLSSGASSAVSSLYEPYGYTQARPEVTFTKTRIETAQLDEWAAQEGVTRLDFMWLDMQGAELRVLSSSTRILPTVSVVVIEVNLTERFKGVPLYDEVVTFFLKKDFELIQKDEPKHNKCNLVWVRSSLLRT